MMIDGFYKAASVMAGAGENREKEMVASMERLGGAEFDDPLFKQYASGHCEMSERVLREDLVYCTARMRFQLPLNR